MPPPEDLASISSFVTDFWEGSGDPDLVPEFSSFGRLVTAGSSDEAPLPFNCSSVPNYNLLLVFLVVFSGFLSLFFLFFELPDCTVFSLIALPLLVKLLSVLMLF